MKFVPGMLKNSQGVIMVIAICILLAITALGIGMVTNAAMSSTIAKNYKNRIQSFYAADGQMTKIAQSVIDSTDSGWTAVGGGISNLITNGDFSSSGTGWTLGNPTYGTVDYSSGYADVTITNAAGATYQPQMMSDPISVKLNTTYTVCFDIKASAARTVNVSLYNGSFLGLNVSGVAVTTSWTRLTFTFIANATASNASFHIDMGANAASVQVDNIVFVAGSSCSASNDAGTYKIISCANSKYTVLSTKLLSATGLDSASGATFAKVPNGDNYKLQEVASSKFVELDASEQLIADTNEQKAMVFGFIPQSAAGDTVAIYAVNDNDADRYTMFGNTVLKATANKCTTSTASNERFCLKTVTAATSTWDTVTMGDYKVAWKVGLVPGQINSYNLQTKALKNNSAWGVIFQTPLNQYIERTGAGVLANFGPSYKVPVTYYDFHSNRTNPEFEQPCVNTTNKNMVGVTLDGQRKMVVGTNPCLNYCVAKWFRPWVAGWDSIPVYRYTTLQYTTVDSNTDATTLHRWRRHAFCNPGGCTQSPWVDCIPKPWGVACCNEITSVANGQNPKFEKTVGGVDTAFKNIVIQDTLTFTLYDAATGSYQYANGNFFPLDGRGFGNEWNKSQANNADTGCTATTPPWSHNYSFTMEIHRTFTMVPGLSFYFSGDDDIWLFLNNRLQMDLGGPHDGGTMTVNVDTVGNGMGAPLAKGTVYNFDFFYCERHSSASHCTIQTNMLQLGPPTRKQRSWTRDYGSLQ